MHLEVAKDIQVVAKVMAIKDLKRVQLRKNNEYVPWKWC
jgi:hypothetical protein